MFHGSPAFRFEVAFCYHENWASRMFRQHLGKHPGTADIRRASNRCDPMRETRSDIGTAFDDQDGTRHV
jgi:hypothetical protein